MRKPVIITGLKLTAWKVDGNSITLYFDKPLDKETESKIVAAILKSLI